MPNSSTKSLDEVDELRSGVNDIANQLCSAVDGHLDFHVVVSSQDQMLQKLVMLINFVLARSQRALQETEDREAQLRTILETASEGIVVFDSTGVISSFNVAAASMFGYEAEEVIGQNFLMLMPMSHTEENNQELESFLKFEQLLLAGQKQETVGRQKDGNSFPMEIAVSEVNMDDTQFFTSIIRDLSQHYQLQAELAQAQKLESVGQLAAGIAHEINTPTQYVGDNTRFLKEAFGDISTVLNKLEGLMQLTKDGSIDEHVLSEFEEVINQADLEYLSEEIPQAIEQSLEGVERVSKIVGAMKDFSHPGNKEMSLANVKENIETTIAVACNEWKYLADLKTEFDPDLPDIHCLVGEINQVILNLIVNAAHAINDVSDEKGTITVGTRQDGDWVEIYIRDTGTGIPEGVRSKIFDPFFTTKEVGKGTGQGLAIAHAVVVKKHGGTIECESELGKGTTFTIRLPIKQTSQK